MKILRYLALLVLALIPRMASAVTPATYAGVDQSITLPTHILVQNGQTTNAITVAWTSPNASVIFQPSTSAVSTIILPSTAGVYTLILTSTNVLNRTSDTALITILAAPTPTATPTPTPVAGSDITPSAGASAGVATVYRMRSPEGVSIYNIPWVATAGAVTLPNLQMFGQILGVTTIPSATSVPSASYNLTLTDEDGLDVLNGKCKSSSNFAPRHYVILDGDGTTTSTPRTIYRRTQLNVSSAGNGGAGTLIIALHTWGN